MLKVIFFKKNLISPFPTLYLQINAKVQQAAVAVGLDGDGFYTKAGQLSGGMRRRLSIAMSLVGDPPIIFMDGKLIFI